MNWRMRLDLAVDMSLAVECTERPQPFLKGWDTVELTEGNGRGKNGKRDERQKWRGSHKIHMFQ